MRKLLIFSIILSALFIGFNSQASLAPQLYLTDIKVEKNSFEPEEKIEGFVSLLNYEDLVVSDLVFHYQVLSNEVDGVPTKIIDEQIGDGTFTLSPGREITRSFEYELPSNLPQDNFKFRVQLANSRGEEMGWIDKIISVGGDGRFLTLDNYWFIKEGEKLAPGAGVNYRVGQVPEVEFEIINNSSFSIDAFPKIVTYKRNVSEPLKEQEGNPVILKPGEKKNQTLFLSELRTPESYLSEVRLYDERTKEAISNPVYFRWIIIGEDAEILFVKLDKTSYKTGEKAKIEIQLAGPANYYLSKTKPKGVLSVNLFNKEGEIVGESRKEIELADGSITMNVLIKKDIENPKIKTRIIKDGQIIDEYDFIVVPEEGGISEKGKEGLGFWFILILIIIIVVILLFAGFIIYYYLRIKKALFQGSRKQNGTRTKSGIAPKKINMKKNKNAKDIFLMILLGFGFMFLGINSASAAVEVTGGCRDTLMIFNSPLPSRIYNVNDVVNFSGKFRTTAPGSSSFFNKITFYITEDKEIGLRDCCGDIIDNCDSQPEKSCVCKQGYMDYYGASSSFYDYTNKIITWFDEVKFLDENQGGVYKIGSLYPSDTLYGNPWVAYNQSFIIPDNLGFSGPVRFYVQYSGTHWTDNWQWSVSYQKSWIKENKPPYVESLDFDGDSSYCGVAPGEGRLGLKWVYQDREGDKESQYNLQIATDQTFSEDSLVIDNYSSAVEGDAPGTINTSPVIKIVNNPDIEKFEIGYNVKYWWRVRVKDENGFWSQWRRGPEFATPVHAYPWPKFTWISEESIAGEKVSFIDENSKCYKDTGEEYYCRDVRKQANYEWDFDYEPLEGFTTDDVETNPIHIYSEDGGYIIRLRIVDKAGSCYVSSNIQIERDKITPPEFKPKVPLPSGFLKNLLSMVSLFLFQ